jgi:hypothetical protein
MLRNAGMASNPPHLGVMGRGALVDAACPFGGMAMRRGHGAQRCSGENELTEEDLRTFAARECERAYIQDRPRPKCSRQDFASGFESGLVYARSLIGSTRGSLTLATREPRMTGAVVHSAYDGLAPSVARACESAYQLSRQRRRRCSRADFAAGFIAALRWANALGLEGEAAARGSRLHLRIVTEAARRLVSRPLRLRRARS